MKIVYGTEKRTQRDGRATRIKGRGGRGIYKRGTTGVAGVYPGTKGFRIPVLHVQSAGNANKSVGSLLAENIGRTLYPPPPSRRREDEKS